MKSIAVLLTVFNRKEKTLACLQSFFNADLPAELNSLEVFLVNDGCTDGTPDAVKAAYPSVNIINGTGNLFWNRGMHLAWKEATQIKIYDYFLWINDDTFFYTHALQALYKTTILYNDERIVVGTTCAVNNSKVITYGGRDKNGSLIIPQEYPTDCGFFNGNIVLIPSSVFEIVGMNDPCFRHALGDFDYGLRASKLGIKSVVAPGILGKCDEHESLATWCDPAKSLSKRWKAFRSPLGQDPEEFFIFESRHNGLLKACFHYLTNHLRVLAPWIWTT
ncbi:glycosyltransferase family 2 protein [Mangrovibacterium diazotrophicum]|uniref:GT2 family glycosyltransferase n=1 Tax=Mangrovibacterium diazotrophicum TaxID=1261403 RepID=A0A419W984_9BACT|nr:glycosyltransferase family 2 protein [Mangrovibacterium diazotrophicum]RKD91974.1 GT2 family glycosyltransferase [Mangrovibacterium diazotrophicum]